MDLILQRLQDITRKAVKLEKSLQQMQADKTRLEQSLEQTQQQLLEKNKDLGGIEEKYEALKLAKSIDSPDDREEVMAKIDLYLKEIDICLRTLGD